MWRILLLPDRSADSLGVSQEICWTSGFDCVFGCSNNCLITHYLNSNFFWTLFNTHFCSPKNNNYYISLTIWRLSNLRAKKNHIIWDIYTRPALFFFSMFSLLNNNNTHSSILFTILWKISFSSLSTSNTTSSISVTKKKYYSISVF